MAELAGKIALVTGASRGIGRMTAMRLAELGATVVVHYRNSVAEAYRVVEEIAAMGGQAFAIQVDLSDAHGPKRVYELMDAELERRFGSNKFDILVNNAGAGTDGRAHV